MSMRVRGATLLVPLLFTASACGSGSSGSGTQPAATATVEVGVVYAGGPGPVPGATPFLRPGSVELNGRDASYEVSVKDGQRTPLRVVAGKYTATAKSGDAMCLDSEFTVQAGKDVPVTVTCSVK